MTTNQGISGVGMDLVNAARRRWGVPALALTLLAGSSTGYAQSGGAGGFGLLDALRDAPAPNTGQASTPAAQPEEGARAPVDLSKLEGSVSVNDYDLVDLHVNSEDLGAVLQLLSIQSQRNIISSNSVRASVTADLYGVTFYEALDAILHVNGFGYMEKGNFIYVYTREELQEFERASRRQISRIINLDYLNAGDAAEFVKHLLSDQGKITTNGATQRFTLSDGSPSGADDYANTATIVVRDYEENVEEIVGLVAALDTKPVQVLVEATILQTSLHEANAFGVDFAIISDLDFADFLGSGGPLSVVDGLISGVGQDITGADVPAAGSNGDGFGIGSNIGNVNGPATLKMGIVSEDVSVFLRVLDEVTDVTVVSNPKLLTLNRQPAKVHIGSKIGYLTTTTTDTATNQTVEFLEVGTQLSVRPFVSSNGLIRLELFPEVSSYRLRNYDDGQTIPDKDTTHMTTNVMLRDGQTAVLGGLFTETTTSSRRQVPLLGDIPIIGSAFRGSDDSTVRSEIIFMITPSIVNDDILADMGEMGTQFLDNARVGARKSLLPFSRERRVGQLLIEARRLADEGDTTKALFLIDRALRLSPMSPDARMMKAELTNVAERFPSRGMMNTILRRELLANERPLVEGLSEPTEPEFEGFAPVTTPAQTEPAYAEVPTEPLSFNDGFGTDDGFGMDDGFDGTTETAGGWTTAATEPVYVEISPEQMLRDGSTASASNPGEDRFGTMKTVATAQPETTLPIDWQRWAEDPSDTSPTIHQVSVREGSDLGGFLVIPLPGGGALQVEWPLSNWDWKNTYTEVPLNAGPGVE